MVNGVRGVLLFASTYAFPAVGFPLLSWTFAASYGWRFALVVMGAPLAFGYLLPGIGTNVLRTWAFRGPLRVGNFYAHHGFIYASKLALVLWLVMRHPESMGALDVAAAVLVAGAAGSWGGWWHDIHAIRAGRIEIRNAAAFEGRSPEEIVSRYAPVAFFVLSATYVLLGFWAYRVLVAKGDTAAWPWLLLGAVAALCVVPTVVFIALDRSYVRARPVPSVEVQR